MLRTDYKIIVSYLLIYAPELFFFQKNTFEAAITTKNKSMDVLNQTTILFWK